MMPLGLVFPLQQPQCSPFKSAGRPPLIDRNKLSYLGIPNRSRTHAPPHDDASCGYPHWGWRELRYQHRVT